MAPNPEDRLTSSDGLEFEPVKARKKSKRHWGRWVSFAVVVMIVAGGGWYFLDGQLPLNQNQSVPIIQADVTPVKIKPADPGGMEVPDRDKLVYDRLKGEGAGTTVERLLPPPETPIPIPEEQLQGSEFSGTTQQSGDQTTESGLMAMTESQSEISQTGTSLAEPVSPTQLADNAPVPLQPMVSEPPALVTPTSPPEPVQPVETAPSTASVMEPAQVEEVQTAQQVMQEQTSTETQPVENILQESSPDYLIQLAALRTHERSEAEWNRLKKAHPDLLGALKPVVVRVDLGEDKGVFFRLRAGPLKDDAAAKTLCGELAKRNVGCLVIRPGK